MAMSSVFFLIFFLVWTGVRSAEVFPMELIQYDLIDAAEDFFYYHETCKSIFSFMESFVSSDIEFEGDEVQGTLTINGKIMFGQFFTSLTLGDSIPLKKITYICPSNNLTIDTMAYGHQAISPYPSFDHDKGIIWDFRMTEVSLSLTRVNKAYSISATGSLKLWDGIAARTSVVKTTDLRGNTDILSFTGSGEIFIDKSEIPNMVHHFTGLDLPKAIANVLVIDSVAISGSLNANSYIGTWFAIKLLGDDARVAMILRDKYPYHHDHMHTGVASELFANISFSEFYPGEMDVSGVPYFGSAIAEDVTYLKLSTEERVCNLPHGMLDDVLLFVPECIEGTDIKAAFSDSIIPYTFRDGTDDVENTSYKKNGSMYEYSGMIGSVGKSAPKLHSYPVNTAITLREVLKIYAPELDLDEMNRNHYFFFDIRTVYNLGILKLTLAPDSESDYLVCIDVIDNKAMSFFFNFLVIDHSDMKFCLTQEKTLDVSVTGEIAIGDVNFEATVEKTGDDYTISARANKLDITDILSHFHAQFLPQDLREVLKNSPFGDFAVENPFIVYQFSSNTSDDKYLQIGGTPSISGYEILDIDAILVHHNTTSDLAGGIFIQSVKLEALFFDITQMSLKGIPMLDQNVNASIVISPATIDHALEEHPDTTIHKGISIEVDMGFPDDCSSNVFCKTIRKLLGEDTHFAVTGTFANSGEFSVSALVENINLGHGYELESAGLKIMVGEDSNSIGITGTLHIEDPALTFSGEIEMATEGVEVQLSMSGCWNHPFHIKLLTICNIEGSIALEPELPVFPSELGIGGELKLGNPDCSKPFVAKGYVGIDAVTPSNNYFYVDFSKVTIGSLLKAFFCWNADKLPRPIQETGFPEGFMSSYSENEIDLPNITIPIGFHLKGVLDILGLRGSADIDIDWSAQKFDIDVKIPPINIGNGMLKMFRSPDNHLQGPYLSANMTFPDSVKIAASGYVEVLGSTEYATLEVTDDSYRFTYTAKVLNLFKAHLEISALYKRPLTDVSFEVKGYFENDLMEAIENFIKNTFDKAVNDAKEKIKEAEADVESKKQALEDAKGKLEEDKRKVDDAYGAFRAADDSLEAAKRKVASALSRCPSWVRWACKGIVWIANKALDAAEWTVNESSHALDLAKDCLTAAEGILDGAEGALDLAEDVLKGVYDACELALAIGKLLDQFIEDFSQFFDIKRIDFDVKLSEAHIGSFDVSITAVILKEEKTLDLNIDLNDIASICRQLAEYIGEGFGSLF